jgi:hypothetical protein
MSRRKNAAAQDEPYDRRSPRRHESSLAGRVDVDDGRPQRIEIEQIGGDGLGPMALSFPALFLLVVLWFGVNAIAEF